MANVVIPSNFPKRTTVTAGTHVIGIQDPDTNPISVLVPSSLLGGTSVNLSQFPQATTYADTDFIAAVRNPGAATPENILIPRSILTANALKIQGRDVLATAPTADQTLVWNAAVSAWEPRTVELSGNALKIQNRNVASTTPAEKQALVWNSTTSVWEPQTVVTASISSINSNLLSFWKLENKNDSVGQNNLTTGGSEPSLVGGKIGSAYAFDGSNYFTTPGNSPIVGLNTQKSYTVSVWIKVAQQLSQLQVIYSQGDDQYLCVDSNLFIQWATYGHNLNSSSTLALNTWYHVLCTYDTITNTKTLSINQANPSSYTYPTRTANSSALTFVIGSYLDNTSVGFRGTIDALGVWDRLLTTQEKNYLYNDSNGNQLPYIEEISATQIQTRPVATTMPAGGEALIWDSTASMWKPGVAGGPQGPAGTITIGTTSTGPAAVTNTGTTSAAVLNFTVPQGPQGLAGSTGPQGPSGTIAVGTVTLGAIGQAAVTNSGTSTAAVFNFTVPKGDTGATGTTGPAGPIGPQGPAGNPADYAALVKANLFYG